MYILARKRLATWAVPAFLVALIAGGVSACDRASETAERIDQTSLAVAGGDAGDDAGSCSSCGAEQCCGATCVDTQTDNDNCGGCGYACGTGSRCVSGACACDVSACTAAGGNACCGSGCTNTLTDDNNCGRCGDVCAPGTRCESGTCTCATSSCDAIGGNACCGSGCTNLDTDNDNCGACGNVCTLGTTCVIGTCECQDGTRLPELTQATGIAKDCGACGIQCAGIQPGAADYGTECLAGDCALATAPVSGPSAGSGMPASSGTCSSGILSYPITAEYGINEVTPQMMADEAATTYRATGGATAGMLTCMGASATGALLYNGTGAFGVVLDGSGHTLSTAPYVHLAKYSLLCIGGVPGYYALVGSSAITLSSEFTSAYVPALVNFHALQTGDNYYVTGGPLCTLGAENGTLSAGSTNSKSLSAPTQVTVKSAAGAYFTMVGEDEVDPPGGTRD